MSEQLPITLPVRLEVNERFQPGHIIVDAENQVIAHVFRNADEVCAAINQPIKLAHLDGDMASIASSLEQLAKCVGGQSFRVLAEKYEV